MTPESITKRQSPRKGAHTLAGALGPGRGDGRPRVAASIVIGLGLLAGAFLLGQRSAPPAGVPDGGQAAPAGRHQEEAGHEEHAGHRHESHKGGAGQDAHEEGVVKFTPAALAKAGVQVQPVTAMSVRAQLQVTGAVEPDLAGVVKITPRVAGKITSLLATVGDTVRAGQVLATMTSTELATAQAQFRQASARVAAAQANLRRQRQLAGFGEFGQHKIQEARGSFNAAQGDVNEAQAEISAARNEVAEAEAAMAAAQSDQVSAENDVAASMTGVMQAQTQVEVTQSRFKRQESLLKEELTSRQDWEQAHADFQKAKTDVQAVQAAVRAAEAKEAAARAKVNQARAQIDTQRSHLEQAQAKLAAAGHRLGIAREALAREENFRSGVLASKEVADAEASVREAEIDRAAAADAVGLLGGTPGGGNTVSVAAPLSGRITERAVTAGETVSLDKPLFTVMNLNSVWVQLNVYQRDLSVIRNGLSVTITTDAVPGKRFSGTVAYIGDSVDETTRTVKVRCVIPNLRGLLKPDMFVRGQIATAARGRGIAVPREAVQTFEGKAVVLVAGDHQGEFEAKEVRVGDPSAGQTVITSGLQSGDRVVTRGAFMVKAQAMKAELGHSH